MRDLGDGGGGRGDDDEAAALFQYAEQDGLSGSATTILGAADDIQVPANNLMLLGSRLDTLHRSVATSTTGTVHAVTADAPRTARNNLRSVLASALCAAGATRVFATDGVQAYNRHVDSLRTEYTSRKLALMASDCGVPEATYPENASVEERKKIDDARETQVDNLRVEKIAGLVRELRARQERFKDDPLDAQATLAANRLKEGPTDQVMIDLFKAGGLPSATVLAFPDLRFVYEKLPSDLTDLSPEELEEYVRNHPEVRPLVEALLRRGTLTGQELELVKAQARVDAQTLREAVESGDRSQATLDKITDGQRFLRLVNQLTGSTKQLSPAAHAYSFTWLDSVGADALANLSRVVAETVPHARETVNYLSPVGDAILNLSNETYQDHVLPENQGTTYAFDLNGDGRIDKEDMPQPIQDLMERRIGEYRDGHRVGGVTEEIQNDISVTTTVDDFNGWANLLAASTVEGGREFSLDLAEQAIQAKQDLNAVLYRATTDPDYEGIDSKRFTELKARLNDLGASHLLSVVSRNENAASDLLLDDTRRQQVLGLNWSSGSGAADLIRAGTDRDPADGGGTSLQAKAALAVMREIASDPQEYMDRITNESTSDAIVDVAITWLDTFGENIGQGRDTPSTVHEGTTDALGRPVALAITLSEADQLAFLQFIADTGDHDAVRFEAASQYYGRQLIADALEQGDQDRVSNALNWAARADGLIRRANIEWAVDELGVKNEDARAKLLAYNRMMAAANVAAKITLEVVSTAGSTAFPGSALFIAGGKSVADSIIAETLAPEPIPDFKAMEVAEADRLLEADAKDAVPRRNFLLAQVAMSNDLANDPKYRPILDEDGSLKSLDEIKAIRHGLNLLQSLAERPIERWNATYPNAERDVRLEEFDTARSGANPSIHADEDPLDKRGWRNPQVAERNRFGDNARNEGQ